MYKKTSFLSTYEFSSLDQDTFCKNWMKNGYKKDWIINDLSISYLFPSIFIICSFFSPIIKLEEVMEMEKKQFKIKGKQPFENEKKVRLKKSGNNRKEQDKITIEDMFQSYFRIMFTF